MLKTVAGIVQQASGSIFLNGICADSLPPHRRGTVIVFQDLRLFPHMTVLENIGFPLKMKGIARTEIVRRVGILLEKVQLSGFEKRKVSEMSGGQLQRVALARALAAEPNVLLLDEPFSSLDESLRQDMRVLIRTLQREFHVTTVMVTHDMKEALAMSDKVALMNNGRILQCDTPESIYRYPVNKEAADLLGEGIYLEGTVVKGIFSSSLFSCPAECSDGSCYALLRTGAVLAGADSAMETGTCVKMKGRFFMKELSYQGDFYTAILEHETKKFQTLKSRLHLHGVLMPDTKPIAGAVVTASILLDRIVFVPVKQDHIS